MFPVAVRDLHRLWKPHKLRLNDQAAKQPTNIRFHRACSWLERAELAITDDRDVALLSQWIAFNSMYGQWDLGRREPVPDKESWKIFLERMLELDADSHIAGVLSTERALVLSIFDDEFLSRHFWQEPSAQRAFRSKRTKFDSHTWYVQQKWLAILDALFDRIYFLRCQLVHGATTYSGELNRTAITRCSRAMDRLLRTFLFIWTEHGADEDWGILCYPPIREV